MSFVCYYPVQTLSSHGNQCINVLSGIPVLAVALARLIYDVRTTSGCLYLGATQCLGGNRRQLVVNGNVIHGSLSLM